MKKSAFLLLLLVACSNPTSDTICTLIGCSSGLMIALPANVTTPFTIRINPQRPAPLVIQCDATTHCGDPVLVEDFTPDNVTIRVEWAGGNVEKNFTPVYTAYKPNGPDCAPTCTTATVSFK